MTRDDIIRMLTEVGLWQILEIRALLPYLERFAALVAAAEREACAKVIDEIAQRHKEQSDATYWALRDAAFQIRNRREKE